MLVLTFVLSDMEKQIYFVKTFYFFLHVYNNRECFVADQKVMQQFFLWEECL